MFRVFKRSTAYITFAAIAGVIIALSGAPANATGTITSSITVNASVANNCSSSVNSPSTITYDPIVANLSVDAQNASGAVVINCTKSDAFTVNLNDGVNAATATTQPRMKGTTYANYLEYAIYYGGYPGTGSLWGTGTTVGGVTGTTLSGVGKGPGVGNELTETLYIDIPNATSVPAQNVVADSYTDSVTATISY